MTNGHGGRRPGAGRPRKAEKYEGQIATAEDRIADHLPRLVENMLTLADGGYERVKETYKPAGLIFVGSGEWATLAFPELPREQQVCIERVVERADKDRKANEYLIDRIAGKPTQAIEIDGDPDGTLEMTASALDEAAQQLAAWRHQMTEQLKLTERLNSLSAPPTLPTSPTRTE